MRTTVDLPSELFRRAKTRAAERGETLKVLLTRALSSELARAQARPGTRPHVGLPLFGDPAGPTVRVRATDLERVLADEDMARIGRPQRRRGR